MQHPASIFDSKSGISQHGSQQGSMAAGQQGSRAAGQHAEQHGSTAAGQQRGDHMQHGDDAVITKNQKKKKKKRERMQRKLVQGTLLAPPAQRRSPASVKRSRNRFAAFILRNRVRFQKRRNNEGSGNLGLGSQSTRRSIYYLRHTCLSPALYHTWKTVCAA